MALTPGWSKVHSFARRSVFRWSVSNRNRHKADFKFLHFLAPCRLLPLPRCGAVLQCSDAYTALLEDKKGEKPKFAETAC